MAQIIDNGTVVSTHYTITDNQGNVIDSADAAKPYHYLHGGNDVIPGVERQLAGKSAGDALTFTLEPSDGYGEVLPELIQTVDKETFEKMDTIEVGMSFGATAPNGSFRVITVTAIDGDDITIDANHSMAGLTLVFDVQVIAIRNATDEEITKGHAIVDQ